MCKECNTINSNGDYEPCCYRGDGQCTAAKGDKIRSNCICCGAEMFEDRGNWYHHSQEYLPIEKRYLTHFQEF